MFKHDRHNQIILSAQYWHAAKTLVDSSTPQTQHHIAPVLNLLCTSCELALKYYLTEKGVPEKALTKKEIRHDLPALFSLAGKHGLVVRTEALEAIVTMARAYKDHMLRYGFVGSSIRYTPPSHMLSATALMIDICSGNPAILRAAHGPDYSSLEWPIDWNNPMLQHLKPTGTS